MLVVFDDTKTTETMTRDTLLLFDVDGTLTEPRKVVTTEMVELLREVRKKYVIGIVGGSDLHKQQEQLALFGSDIRKEFDYVFSENGLVAYHNGEVIGKQNIAKFLGEENLKKIINWTLIEIANIDIPIKRGTFIEYRNGMLNVSPIGRNCSQAERDAFDEYDKVWSKTCNYCRFTKSKKHWPKRWKPNLLTSN